MFKCEVKVVRCAGTGVKGTGIAGRDDVDGFAALRLKFFVILVAILRLDGLVPTEKNKDRGCKLDDVQICGA